MATEKKSPYVKGRKKIVVDTELGIGIQNQD